MELTGKIIDVLPLKKGVSLSTNKEWVAQQFVIETQEQYPHKCCLQIFGQERIDKCKIQKDEVLTVMFDVDAREYNGKWYNDFKCFSVKRPYTVIPEKQHVSMFNPVMPQESAISDDDLPF